MELATVLQLVVAITLPFVLYILHGIGRDLREVREGVTSTITRQAVTEAELRIVKKQLHLLDEASAS